MQQAIIIFVRKPILGQVKTRLAATIGNPKTLEVYNHLLLHTKAITELVEADKFVFYTNAIEQHDLWHGYHKQVQVAGDLGFKMSAAFKHVFSLGYSKVCIIGSDCYDLNATIITNAFDALHEHDVAIGPANDGGYYLLAMRSYYQQLFEHKVWSSSTVYNHTVQDCVSLNLHTFILPTLIDIDDIHDLKLTNLYTLLNLDNNL